MALSPYMPSDFSYSKDTQNRAAFMEVLTKILQQGAEFNMLADSVLADRYEQLVQLITMISDKGELPIAMALANVVTTSQMVNDVLFKRQCEQGTDEEFDFRMN